MKDIPRCSWAQFNEEMIAYHDNEWGRPQHDDRTLFEMLNLEGAQAGLSWLTILKRRQAYRRAFDNFDPQKVAAYTDDKRVALQQDETIIRNRLKINAFIKNAQAYLRVMQRYKTFDEYVWQWNLAMLPYSFRQTEQALEASVAMSVQLKKDGFTFVGPTICYAYMQATGMVNDHEKDCYLHSD